MIDDSFYLVHSYINLLNGSIFEVTKVFTIGFLQQSESRNIFQLETEVLVKKSDVGHGS